ncbi:Uncharacterised protein [Mycolicibacterium vanbaalenii]|uniref:Uncharacterized protein n=1 Tax=Mycolicibacterium vanbaalenii TaxID=110539 RepID=A0A5S9RBK1_MYCVN|nr:MCE family protein [Mycolicibacterium vanbaalenii]CAA0137646.1 Uncharacterised protein [Mycolicibacterium vanbaalenii]
MIEFSERNPFVIGAIGVGLTAVAALAAINYDRIPLVDRTEDYSAYFSEASGLKSGAPVELSGVEIGKVTDLALAGDKVLVTFKVGTDVALGERTEAAVKTKSLLGAKFLELTSRGNGNLSVPIPLDRTKPAYQLADALGDLTTTISGLDTGQVTQSLQVLADTFADTPPELRVAVQGVARFSETLDKRDQQLRDLLANANRSTAVLRERGDQIASLVEDTNALLANLRTQRAALDQISGNITGVTEQLKGLIAENRDTLKPALDKLNGVLTIIDNRKTEIQESLVRLNRYALSLGEAVSSGPFYKAYLANLLPGQFIQPFVDAAFSDLGLDPNVLLPSETTDPQVGQPGTPALPAPYPRTGQGGDPRLTLPDAITGNPGDPRYPYRQPPAAPPPGGPPPGPPAPPPAGQESIPPPGPGLMPAPGEQPPAIPQPGSPTQGEGTR